MHYSLLLEYFLKQTISQFEQNNYIFISRLLHSFMYFI